MPSFADIWYPTDDGLQLYARDYNAVSNANPSLPAVLCMHGLTRNSADFENLAERLANDYRVIAVDQRGRGRSDYDLNYENYNPQVYVQDMFTLLDHLQIQQVILIGTSMGGIMGMMMAVAQPDKIQGLVINDIGPEVANEGLERIQNYVGKVESVKNWRQAATACMAINGPAFPAYSDEDWELFAKRIYRQTEQGELELAYDKNIAAPFKDTDTTRPTLNLWPVFEQIQAMPLLVIRGQLSDILAQSCVTKMRRLRPNIQIQEVPGVGHAPSLDEPTAIAALERFFTQFN